MAQTTLNVLGISGSLRKGSLNSAALRAAMELAPEGMRIERLDLGEMPLYDDDVRERGYPPAPDNLRHRIRAADAVLLVTPEYNYSTSGVLKNAIDWASRPPDQPFAKKPVGLMGASPGRLGSARAQYHLRQSFVYLNSYVMNTPEVMIPEAHKKFDAQGRLTDEQTREFIAKFLIGLSEWTTFFRR
jgi:chromate reductase, NAD(P)H dehydrogenase (quinone)